MGKHGARELNYSSDVDLIALHDPARAPVAEGVESDALFARLTHHVVRLLQARTADDYVLRVDLRLRPDPSSTPPSVPLPAAYQYYETIGQDWERAAFIKARPVAGDLVMGARIPGRARAFHLAPPSRFQGDRRLAPLVARRARRAWRRRGHHGAQRQARSRRHPRMRARDAGAAARLRRARSRGCAASAPCRCSRRSSRPAICRRRRAAGCPRPISSCAWSSIGCRCAMTSRRRCCRATARISRISRCGAALPNAKAFEKEFAARTAEVRAEAQKAFGVRQEPADEAELDLHAPEARRHGLSSAGRGLAPDRWLVGAAEAGHGAQCQGAPGLDARCSPIWSAPSR